MRFSASFLKDYCEKLMTARGVDVDCAETVADMLLDAELTGVSTHGVSRLAIYLERVEKGLVSRHNEVKVLRESPSAVAIDAGNSLGAVGAKFAMETCIRKARETGCCFATVKRSNHFGAAAYYTRMAAKEGMIGFCCTNLTAKIAPHGAAEPFMGTDPISLAVPSDGFPVVLDMTPSVVALGKLILAQKLGKDIPLGWALDRDGKPTADPAAGREGSLIPIGGPKGSGLALMVEVLSGILSGAGTATHLHDLYEFDAPQGVGHFLGAIDVSHFLDSDAFRAGVSAMAGEIKGLKRAEGIDEILLPGERSARNAKQKARDGIDVPEAVCAELSALGEPYGMKLEEA
ncbi:MAG: Ldh family oxidoreductase [Oscillospiraceae bacterium]|nr:Ldh family oxidoreductase [Oscillospiraceae bacterium]